jgi:hypothetical protein
VKEFAVPEEPPNEIKAKVMRTEKPLANRLKSANELCFPVS